MRLLKYSFYISLSSLIAFVSCSQKMPLSPEDAFKEVKYACEKKDPKRLLSLYSKGTIAAFVQSAKTISSMTEKQRESLFSKGQIPKKDSINAQDLVMMQITMSQTAQDDPVLGAFSQNVISIQKNSGIAIIKTSSGVDLRFVKEGSYWKFSPEGK